ncbi:MAG: hypothetical protein WCI73_18300, partial [Phycisphaerae bacterium]
ENLLFIGAESTLQRLQTLKPTARPDIENAWRHHAVGESPSALQVVFALTPDARRVIREIMPLLPAEVGEEMGGGSTEFISAGMRALTLTVALPPRAAVGVVLEARGLEDAQKMAGLITQLLEKAQASKEFAAALEAPDMQPEGGHIIRTLLAAAKPQVVTAQVEGRAVVQVRLGMSSQQIHDGAAEILVPALRKSRAASLQAVSQSHLKQVGIGLMCYAENHGGVLPPDLGSVMPLMNQDVRLFVLPEIKVPTEIATGTAAQKAAWVNANGSYVYLHAGEKIAQIANPSRTIVAHEKFDLPGNHKFINALFVDGHVEAMTRAALETALGKK